MKTIFFKEMKLNMKTLLLWSFVVGGLGLACILLYQSMQGDMKEMADAFSTMGAFSDAFGMSTLSIATLKAMYGENWKDEYYDVVTFPIVNPENPKVGAGVSGYAISSTCQNRDIAWKFLKFITSKEGQNCIADAGMNFPSIRKDMSDPINPENHWGVGYENYNMSAYTWASDNNYIAPTIFTLIKPGRSLDLVDSIKVMINNYVCDGYTAQKAMNKCAQSLEYWLDN